MAVLSKPTLRDKLSSVFDQLFLDDKDVLLVLHDFLSSKTAQKSSKNAADSDAVADDAIGDNEAAAHTSDNVLDDSLLPSSFVRRQTIAGLFGPGFDEAALLEECRFTNGDAIHLEHHLHSFVESPLDKHNSEKVFLSEGYAPSDALLVASVNCFSRKKKRDFFRDGLYLCSVFSKEMGMSLSTFLRVRGWLVVNKKGVIRISYRRIGDCLRLLGKEGAVNYYRLSAMFDRLFRVLHSRDIWPLMPYEKGEFPPCMLFSLTFGTFDLILILSRRIESSDNKNSQSVKRKGRNLIAPPRKKRSKEKDSADSEPNSLDSYFEESTSKTLTLCNYERVELLDFHKRESSFGKLLTYQQTLQLGLSAVRVCFEKAIPGQYTSDDSFMEQLFCVIFFKCSDRRMMLEGKCNPPPPIS